MATAFTGVLTAEDIALLTADPSVTAARSRLGSSNVVYTSASLPAATRSRLQETLGLNLTTMDSVPMRWIRGDTPAHVDVGRSAFEKTYLVYMTDSPGSLVVDGTAHPITQGTAYVFNEGLRHETVGTGDEPRLLLGPMSERAFPVGGGPGVFYYPNEADALANINIIGGSGYTVTTFNNISSWRIASNSSGTSPQNVIYNAGDLLDVSDNSGNSAYYFMYPADTCCQAALDFKGLDYTTRAQVITGISILSGAQRKPMSYSQYLSMKKAISAKRRT